MNRDRIWQLLKQHGITQSTRPDCPPDADLSVVIRHAPVSSKALLDFICSLDGEKKKIKTSDSGLTEKSFDL